jgi:hypothetical protein
VDQMRVDLPGPVGRDVWLQENDVVSRSEMSKRRLQQLTDAAAGVVRWPGGNDD